MQKQNFTARQAVNVFISSIPGQARAGEVERREVYRRDEKLRARLEASLAPFCKSGHITLWHDGQISGGDAWEQEITDHLNAAEIILLLLSADFFASEFCYAQMEQALLRRARGARVIPIYLRPVDALEFFPVGELEPLPGPGRPISRELDQDLAWYWVAEGVSAVVEARQLSGGSSLLLSELVYRDLLRKHLPAPRASSLAPRLSLVESIYQHLTAENITSLILSGLSGAGKTVLAAQIYYRVEKEQRAGQGPFAHAPLWLHIEPAATLIDVIGSLGKALGHPLPPTFSDLTTERLAEELFTLVESADRLIVLNQFENWLDPQSGQARPEHAGVDEWLALLNAGSEKCSGRVLLTSHVSPRRLLHYGEACLQHYDIAGLSALEGVQFLRQSRAPALERAPDKELTALVERCQGHALTLAALRERFTRDAGLRLADLLREEWPADEILFATLDALYSKQLKPEQRALLRAFALYREATPLAAARAVVASHGKSASGRFAGAPPVLLDLAWLQAPDQDAYRLHPAISDFVRQKMGAAAQRTMHLRIAREYQERFQRLLSSEEEKKLEDFSAIVEAIWHLCRVEQRDEAYRLLRETELFSHLHRWGHNSALLAIYLDLLATPDREQETALEARLYHELGEIRNALGQKNEALQAYQRALALYRQVAEPEGIVEALNDLGAMHRAQRAYQQARECYQEALRLCEQTPRRIMQQGTTFNNLGRLIYERGTQARRDGNSVRAQACYQEALAYYEQALAWYQDNELVGEEAVALNNLGEVYQELGEREQARACYWRALARFQERGERRGEGLALNNLGQLYQHMLRQHIPGISIEETRVCYEQALRLFRETGDRWQERIALSNLGRCYPTCHKLAEPERYRSSVACLAQARRIARELRQPQEAQIPMWIEATIRRWLVDSGSQSYETFLREIEEQAEEIIGERLRWIDKGARQW